MADPDFFLCSSQAIIDLAGVGVNSTAAASGAIIGGFYKQAEGRIITKTRQKWVTNPGGRSEAASFALFSLAASMSAKSLIQHDMAGYQTLHAQTKLNVLDDDINDGFKILENLDADKLKDPTQ
ncbi:hypothetical protein LCGC14_0774280 [marine sediment metagenome]|uniref:Uncharacterized protein n=1 Tax=marine sediment metagenome TaxID=412755 RepID=A0A0F9PXN9_9ZZZZ